MVTKKSQNIAYNYKCEKCDYYSNKKSDFEKHCLTKKHERRDNGYSHDAKSHQECEMSPMHKCLCGRTYKFRQGLSRHKKSCIKETAQQETAQQETTQQETTQQETTQQETTQQDALKSLIIEIMKENMDKIDILINENKELKSQVENIIPYIENSVTKTTSQEGSTINASGNTINITNTINATQNNHFNIQVFLNEQCKDAINMSDFIKTIDVSLEQMDYTKRHGLAHGLSKTIIENLNRLSIYERPLHCTDVKRETLYIKDNDQWTKEDSREQVMKAIRSATFANYRTLKEWQGLHPGYEKDDTLTDYFLKTVIELGKSLEGIDRHIIRLLCREAYIRQALKQYT